MQLIFVGAPVCANLLLIFPEYIQLIFVLGSAMPIHPHILRRTKKTMILASFCQNSKLNKQLTTRLGRTEWEMEDTNMKSLTVGVRETER